MSLIDVKEDVKVGSDDPGEREIAHFNPPVAVATTTEWQPPQTGRPFAAKYHHRTSGVWLAIGGGLSVVVGLASYGYIIVGLILLAISVYLLRGQGVNPKIVQREAARMAEIAQRKAVQMSQATAALQNAAHSGQRGASAVAYRNLWATAEREYPQEVQAQVGEALASIGLDASSFESPQIGVISSLDGRRKVEVFRDWIIYGQEAHDVDATTRGDVHVDGSVQLMSSGKQSPAQNTRVDMRTAQVQFVSSSWAMGVPIHPDRANKARLVVAQLAVNIESLKPRGVTAQDIRAMVDAILNNTGQPPAEKLQQLSNLRYERLLSDEEFEQAKSRILGIS
jgi:hypothetical protein